MPRKSSHKTAKKVFRKKTPKTSRVRKVAVHRNLNPYTQNYCTIVETISPSVPSIPANVALFSQTTTSGAGAGGLFLSDTIRALNVAPFFQWYRIAEVEWIYSPFWTTFQEETVGAALTPSVPQLYFIMNRSGSFAQSATGINTFIEQGAKPRPWDKPFTVKYKPNTVAVSSINYNPVGGSQVTMISEAFNKWFPTYDNSNLDAFNVPFFGHMIYIRQDDGGVAGNIGRVDIKVRVEFKQPAIKPSA